MIRWLSTGGGSGNTTCISYISTPHFQHCCHCYQYAIVINMPLLSINIWHLYLCLEMEINKYHIYLSNPSSFYSFFEALLAWYPFIFVNVLGKI